MLKKLLKNSVSDDFDIEIIVFISHSVNLHNIKKDFLDTIKSI